MPILFASVHPNRPAHDEITPASVMVQFLHRGNIVVIVKISNIAELTSNKGIMHNEDMYAQEVVNAANETREWIAIE